MNKVVVLGFRVFSSFQKHTKANNWKRLEKSSSLGWGSVLLKCTYGKNNDYFGENQRD